MKSILFALASVMCLGLIGCSTSSGFARQERIETDKEYMAHVERQAAKVNTRVVWINPPVKREKIQSARAAYSMRNQ